MTAKWHGVICYLRGMPTRQKHLFKAACYGKGLSMTKAVEKFMRATITVEGKNLEDATPWEDADKRGSLMLHFRYLDVPTKEKFMEMCSKKGVSMQEALHQFIRTTIAKKGNNLKEPGA